MLNLSPATPIFVALQPVDTRAGFNRLHAHVYRRLAVGRAPLGQIVPQ